MFEFFCCGSRFCLSSDSVVVQKKPMLVSVHQFRTPRVRRHNRTLGFVVVGSYLGVKVANVFGEIMKYFIRTVTEKSLPGVISSGIFAGHTDIEKWNWAR